MSGEGHGSGLSMAGTVCVCMCVCRTHAHKNSESQLCESSWGSVRAAVKLSSLPPSLSISPPLVHSHSLSHSTSFTAEKTHNLTCTQQWQHHPPPPPTHTTPLFAPQGSPHLFLSHSLSLNPSLVVRAVPMDYSTAFVKGKGEKDTRIPPVEQRHTPESHQGNP